MKVSPIFWEDVEVTSSPTTTSTEKPTTGTSTTTTGKPKTNTRTSADDMGFVDVVIDGTNPSQGQKIPSKPMGSGKIPVQVLTSGGNGGTLNVSSTSATVKPVGSAIDFSIFEPITRVTTKDGIKITDVSWHATERKGERIVSIDDIIDALINPLHITEIREQANGRSKKYQGEKVQVVVNPDTGNVVTVMPMGSDLRKRLKRKLGIEE